MLIGDSCSPILKLATGPLEPVIGMTELASAYRLPHDVVFPVRRRQHDGFRTSELEQDSFEGRQSWRVEVLDDVDDSSGVEALQPPVAVHQRSMDQSDPLGLPVRETLQLEPLLGSFQGAD